MVSRSVWPSVECRIAGRRAREPAGDEAKRQEQKGCTGAKQEKHKIPQQNAQGDLADSAREEKP